MNNETPAGRETRYLVMMLDSGKMPRAWASSPDIEAARKVAKEQLAEYIAKRVALGEQLSEANFTETSEAYVIAKGKHAP